MGAWPPAAGLGGIRDAMVPLCLLPGFVILNPVLGVKALKRGHSSLGVSC